MLAATAVRGYTDTEAHIAAELATRDGLTGLPNRRHFTNLAVDRLVGERSAAAIMIDIDHFKAINDTHGHTVGDEVIREVSHRLSDSLREPDIISPSAPVATA